MVGVPFDTGAVANYVLELGDRDKKPISPMKLQKVLYFAHGWHLALTDKPLLDEQVEAWQWGPVIPSIYHEFKWFGPNPIAEARYCTIEMKKDGSTGFQLREPKLDDCSGDVATAKAVIDRVWQVYCDYSAVQLSNMTHQPGTPWYEVWEAMGPAKRKS
ncbi:MAG: hypothetical protein C0468_00835, partial [Planctomyces sp.]|nr:hypothetical protein [Planctomyces sp.]